MAKGGNFERELCKKLSLWWSNGKADDWFWRTSGSGSRATMRRKNNKIKEEDFGDIKSDHPETKEFCDLFCFEAKTGYCKKTKVKRKKDASVTSKEVLWSVLDLLDSAQKEPQFISFWNQVERDSKIVNKIPLLIFRRPQRKPCIAMYQGTFEIFQSFCTKKIDFPIMRFKINNPDILYKEITVMPLYGFFSWSQGVLNEPIKRLNASLKKPVRKSKLKLKLKRKGKTNAAKPISTCKNKDG